VPVAGVPVAGVCRPSPVLAGAGERHLITAQGSSALGRPPDRHDPEPTDPICQEGHCRTDLAGQRSRTPQSTPWQTRPFYAASGLQRHDPEHPPSPGSPRRETQAPAEPTRHGPTQHQRGSA
jgi:hypothetical protein